jgi:calcium binding protein 39
MEALFSADCPMKSLLALGSYDFEDRKRCIRAFDSLVQRSCALGIEARLAVYFQERGPPMSKLVLQASQDPELAMHLGSIFRACSRSSLVVEGLLEQGIAEDLLDLAACENFEAASYAFAALRDLFEASEAGAEYLLANFQQFFRKYDRLLRSKEYATCRQALGCLHTLLGSEPERGGVVAAYVSEPMFLQTHMNLLRSDSGIIRLQAFHVFKQFVLYPDKAAKVQAILHRNRMRLTKLLVSYSSESGKDVELRSILSSVVDVLHALVPPPTSSRLTSQDGLTGETSTNTILPLSSI